MKLVVGLGNPGREYVGTRHNVGFAVADRLASEHTDGVWREAASALQVRWRRGGPDEDVLIVKPLTFMNLSGQSVGEIVRFYKIALSDVLIVSDDVNLALGRLRARASGSEGGHNGLRSIAQHFGTIEYPRLRVGVGRGDGRRDLADHVLARFDAEEADAIAGAIGRAAEAADLWIREGLVRMMSSFNRWAGDGTGDGNPEATDDAGTNTNGQ